MRIFALVLLLAVPICAQEEKQRDYSRIQTGNGFLELCGFLAEDNAPADATPVGRFNLCVGYFEGMLNAAESVQRGINKKAFCIPTDPATDRYLPDYGQFIRLFVKFLRDHPQETHHRTSNLFVLSLQEAFPCGKK